ncbi:hypothetical protein [Streptomyces sp. NPDC004014]
MKRFHTFSRLDRGCFRFVDGAAGAECRGGVLAGERVLHALAL